MDALTRHGFIKRMLVGLIVSERNESPSGGERLELFRVTDTVSGEYVYQVVGTNSDFVFTLEEWRSLCTLIEYDQEKVTSALAYVSEALERRS